MNKFYAFSNCISMHLPEHLKTVLGTFDIEDPFLEQNSVDEVDDAVAGQDVFDEEVGLLPIGVGHHDAPGVVLSGQGQLTKVVRIALTSVRLLFDCFGFLVMSVFNFFWYLLNSLLNSLLLLNLGSHSKST